MLIIYSIGQCKLGNKLFTLDWSMNAILAAFNNAAMRSKYMFVDAWWVRLKAQQAYLLWLIY